MTLRKELLTPRLLVGVAAALLLSGIASKVDANVLQANNTRSSRILAGGCTPDDNRFCIRRSRPLSDGRPGYLSACSNFKLCTTSGDVNPCTLWYLEPTISLPAISTPYFLIHDGEVAVGFDEKTSDATVLEEVAKVREDIRFHWYLQPNRGRKGLKIINKGWSLPLDGNDAGSVYHHFPRDDNDYQNWWLE